jgi:hypothetical protein
MGMIDDLEVFARDLLGNSGGAGSRPAASQQSMAWPISARDTNPAGCGGDSSCRVQFVGKLEFQF